MGKANAHFVDCDINPDTLTWTCEGQGSLSTYKYMHIQDNGHVWGVPVINRTLLMLDAAPAVDLGAGLVEIPYTGNPFLEGETVVIAGTTNYNESHVLQAGTDASRLVIEPDFGYKAETFNGDETVVKLIDNLPSSNGRMVQDSSFNLYYDHVAVATGTCVTKIETDGSQVTDFLTWPFTVTASTRARGLEITANDRYLYVYTQIPGYIIKFDLTTGTADWYTGLNINSGYDMDIDGDGNAYIPHVDGLQKFDAGTGASLGHLTWMGQKKSVWIGGGIYEILTADDLGVAIVGGYQLAYTSHGVGDLLYNFAVRTYDDSAGDQIAVGGTYIDGIYTKTYNVGAECVLVHDNYIYVLVLKNGSTIYKLWWDGTNLSEVSNAAGPTYGVGLFMDLWGNLVVVNQDWGAGQSDIFYYYDTDLNYISKLEPFPTTMLQSWDQGVGGPWVQGGVAYYGNVASTGTITPVQARALWTASDYRHLSGETVQVLGDGAYLGTETLGVSETTTTYSEGTPIGLLLALTRTGTTSQTWSSAVNASLDDNTTVNHVGLQYTSYLQPMKLDGEAFTKNIKMIFPQFYNTLGGKYGESLSELWEIRFRDRDAPFGSSSDLFSNHKELAFDGSYNRQGDIWLTQDYPLPMTVLGIVIRLMLMDGSQ